MTIDDVAQQIKENHVTTQAVLHILAGGFTTLPARQLEQLQNIAYDRAIADARAIVERHGGKKAASILKQMEGLHRG